MSEPEAPSTQESPTSGMLSVERIVDELEGRHWVGCGCIGLLVVSLLFVYGAGRWWLGGADFGLVLAGTMGAAAYAASRLRGFHLLTGAAWTVLGVMALGAAPILFALAFPDAPAEALPRWMRESTWTWALVAGAAVVLMILMIQMRRTISTAEAFYAIQIQAAANRMSLDEVGDKLDAALDVLQEAAELGMWPLCADFLEVHDKAPPPRDHHAAMVLKPLLAVRARPEEGEGGAPWVPFGARPYLKSPDPWVSTLGRLAPLGVGQIFCDPGSLFYVPLRRQSEILSIPLTDIRRVRVYAHAFELDTASGRCAFVGVHLWRTLSLALFLRSYSIDLDEVGDALYALRLRGDNALEEASLLEAIPQAEVLSARLEALSGTESDLADIHKRAQEAIGPLMSSPWPVFRAASDHILRVIEHLGRGELEAARVERDGAGLFLDSFPPGALSPDVARLLEDLEGAICSRESVVPPLR